MAGLHEEALVFRRRKKRETEEARQTVAFFLACGVDLAAAVDTAPEARDGLRRKLARLIERERLRGAARHWSYDLNRHIALKQALDRLGGDAAACPAARAGPVPQETQSEAVGRHPRRKMRTARRFS